MSAMRSGPSWLQKVAAFRQISPGDCAEFTDEARELFGAIQAEGNPQKRTALIAAHLATAHQEGYDLRDAEG